MGQLINDNVFVFSTFCMYEFEVALHHALVSKRHKRLIVMMADDSPSSLLTGDDPAVVSLRQYLRQHTYVDCVRDKKWFDKLLYALPVNGMLPSTNNDIDLNRIN